MQECRILNGAKCRKKHCPYYHNEEERRHSIKANYKLFPRNRGTTVSQTQQYEKHFMSNMFKDEKRTLNVCWHPQQQYRYVDQTIYGCGPQSVPILDPRVVLEYQKFCMGNTYFDSDKGQIMDKKKQSDYNNSWEPAQPQQRNNYDRQFV